MVSAERQPRQRSDRQIHNRRSAGSISGVLQQLSEAHRFGDAEPGSRARGRHAIGRSKTESRGVSEVSIDEIMNDVTPIRSDLSRFSRGTADHPTEEMPERHVHARILSEKFESCRAPSHLFCGCTTFWRSTTWCAKWFGIPKAHRWRRVAGLWAYRIESCPAAILPIRTKTLLTYVMPFELLP
jgi:hypothetical protein